MEVNEELYRQFFAAVGPEPGKVSQTKAAQAMGYQSGAVVSAYKSRTYKGDVKTLEERIEQWLGRERRRLERIQIPVVETAAMGQIRRAITMAQDEADIAVVVGKAGTGKTTAVQQYVRENQSAVLVEVDPSFTRASLVVEIARAVGADQKGNARTLIGRIVDALRERDAVLIVDEADYLTDSSLELLRRVVNDKSQTGVVLVGLPRLEYSLRSLKNDHEQLASRVGVMTKVRPMGHEDAGKILREVWPNLDKEAAAAFVGVAAGSVRTLAKLMGRVHQVLGVNRVPVPDADIVAAASEMLMK